MNYKIRIAALLMICGALQGMQQPRSILSLNPIGDIYKKFLLRLDEHDYTTAESYYQLGLVYNVCVFLLPGESNILLDSLIAAENMTIVRDKEGLIINPLYWDLLYFFRFHSANILKVKDAQNSYYKVSITEAIEKLKDEWLRTLLNKCLCKEEELLPFQDDLIYIKAGPLDRYAVRKGIVFGVRFLVKEKLIFPEADLIQNPDLALDKLVIHQPEASDEDLIQAQDRGIVMGEIITVQKSFDDIVDL